MSRSSITVRLGRLLLAAGVALTLALALVTAGAPKAAAAAGGWIRLAHLSPDTPAVDVALTALNGDRKIIRLTDVGYGDVSSYQRVPAGTYVATMAPPRAKKGATPVITQSVTVKNDYAYTVAAVGKRADLRGTVLNDDLRAPRAGTAKVRLLQASTNAPRVTVTAVDGPVLARNAPFATATGYAQIAAGVWTVKIAPTEGTAAEVSAKVTATPGSINTVVVLDGKDGEVRTEQIKDASGATTGEKGTTPKKGIETGEGGTATTFVGGPSVPPVALGGAALGVAVLTGVGVVLTRRRRLAS